MKPYIAVVAVQEEYHVCRPRERRSIIGRQNLSPFSTEIRYIVVIRIKIPWPLPRSCCFYSITTATLVFLLASTRCDSGDTFMHRGHYTYLYRESTTLDYACPCVLSNCYFTATHKVKLQLYLPTIGTLIFTNIFKIYLSYFRKKVRYICMIINIAYEK